MRRFHSSQNSKWATCSGYKYGSDPNCPLERQEPPADRLGLAITVAIALAIALAIGAAFGWFCLGA